MLDLDGDEPTDISGVLLTHAHVDHCKYISYLRPDIPIYCSEASKLIMQNYDETGNFDQYSNTQEKDFKFTRTKKERLAGQQVNKKVLQFQETSKYSRMAKSFQLTR